MVVSWTALGPFEAGFYLDFVGQSNTFTTTDKDGKVYLNDGASWPGAPEIDGARSGRPRSLVVRGMEVASQTRWGAVMETGTPSGPRRVTVAGTMR